MSQETGAFGGQFEAIFEVLSAGEADRQTALYAPLADAVRDLIDATIRTEADDDVVAGARTAIEAVTQSLRQRTRPVKVSYRVDGRPLPLGNAAVGVCNPIAPPIVVRHEGNGQCWSEFVLGSAYEGPPGRVHGGVSALVLDHLLGEAASEGLSKARFTGTITVKYLRGTPLGPTSLRRMDSPQRGRQSHCPRYYFGCRRGDRGGRRHLHRAGMGAGSRMKFYVSSAFLNTREIVEIAKAADELGYDGIGIPDHVVNLETLQTPYPYTKDGQRRWQPFTDWPDPWVLVGALAQVTTRLRFVTTVYIPAMRNPYSAAKAIGTAAVLASGRVELGIGIGWCREEFALMGQQFDARGKRTDEIIDLMRALWEPGWTQFDGEFYPTPRLEMQPTPPPIPIYAGGLSDAALRRAARNDGWIGDLIKTDRAIEAVGRFGNCALKTGFRRMIPPS